MLKWAELRASAVLWLILPAASYLWLHLDSYGMAWSSRYGVQSGELASVGVAVTAPVMAAGAAWAAGRHRRLGHMDATSPRPVWRRLARATAPLWVLHAVLSATALVIARVKVGVWPGGPGWLAVAHLVLLPAGWLAIGWCAGRALPRSVAAPLLGIGCWAWLAFPQSFTAPWWRHVNGFVATLSDPTVTQVPTVYFVAWAVTASLVLAAWLMTGRRRRMGVAAGAAVVAGALAGGGWAVDGWGYGGHVRARGTALVCVGEAPRVCVPPEYRPYADTLRRDTLEPLARVERAGVAPPRELRVVSEDAPVPPGVWPLTHWSPPRSHPGGATRSGPDVLVRPLIAGVAAQGGKKACVMDGTTPAYWAALVTTGEERPLPADLAPGRRRELEDLRRRPAAQQVAWFTQAVRGDRYCWSEKLL
ncbi:hypothetical protein LUX01_16160 [Streptomyces sudanensis]|uniref:DUF7224 domain-containing protein n=1 Tax=Streptomyces sudanensis TaxID=436397 RepID=UPI0020CEA1FA|nr:hypothetical protein [Streptomyces sudanensis]MCP9987983.1 hypothetical protein [Streptomyces sudanensis]